MMFALALESSTPRAARTLDGSASGNDPSQRPGAVPASTPPGVTDELLSHVQHSDKLGTLLALSEVTGAPSVFAIFRTLHEMSIEESWEFAQAVREDAENVPVELRPYLTQRVSMDPALGRGEGPRRHHQPRARGPATLQRERLVSVRHRVLGAHRHPIVASASTTSGLPEPPVESIP